MQDDILRRNPAISLTLEVDAKNVRRFELPRCASHCVNCIRTSHTDGKQTQTPGIRRVGISAQHEYARGGIILKDNLMNDARTWSPELDSYSGMSVWGENQVPVEESAYHISLRLILRS